MNRKHSISIAAILMLGLSTSVLEAHKGATGVVKQRMDSMKSIAGEMKKLKAVLFGNGKINKKQVRTSAKIIKQHAVIIPRQFPGGSNKHPSEASKNIWNDFNDFEKEAGRLASFADALLISSDNPSAPEYKPQQGPVKDIELLKKSAPQAAFFAMASTCQSCHQSFREKK